MVLNKLKNFVKKIAKKKREKVASQPHTQEERSNATDGVERTETETGPDAVRTQPVTTEPAGEPVPTPSTREQSTAGQEIEKSTSEDAEDKDKLGVNILCAGKDPVVDIVFLHGLTGKRDSTWTRPGGRKPWPEDLLGKDMERARIITYGYDADVVHLTRPAGQESIRQHSSNVLLDLGNLRSRKPSSRGRPIIFVVHSLGGLVIEDAIFYSQNHPDEAYVDISKSTKGVVFFGTPHAGSSMTKFADALANLIWMSFVKRPNQALLDVLKRNSAMLANIENDFMGLVRRRARNGNEEIRLFAFLESLPVTATGHRVVAPESATITGYPFAGINANHMDMTKFASRNTDYDRVFGVLDSWVDSLEPIPDPIQEETDEPNLGEPNDVNFGREIYFCNRSSVKNHTRRSRLLQTIHEQFESREENRSSVVILQALGGQGKTQLAIDYCYQSWKKRRYHAVFFLNASSEQTLRGEMIALVDVLKSPAQTFENDDAKFHFVLSKIKSWNRPWLLVLDNYDKPQTFPSIDQDYIPHTNYGRILVTTRHQALDELGKTLLIPPMTPEEAAELLIKASGILDRTSRATPGLSIPEELCVTDIVNRLGCLPLAVHQAAAYIRYKELDVTDFMEDYESRKAAIWNRKPELWGYGQTVYTTWELSYDLIDVEQEPRHRKGALLTMLAFLDYRSISRELFDVPRAVQNLEAYAHHILDLVDPVWLREILRRDGNWDIMQVEDRLDLFRDLSLLQILDRSKRRAYKISFHPLVADWVKYRVHSDKLTEHQCLFQASVLVLACLKDQARPEVASLLSEQAREEVMRHQAACLSILNQLREEDTSPDFAQAIGTVLNEIRELPKLIQESRDKQSSQYRRNILHWLSPNSQEEVLLQLLRSKTPGTCDWIHHTDAFVQWEAGQASVLLTSGPAGSGKSVLMASVVESLLQQGSKSNPQLEIVAFCFVQFHDFGAWSAQHVLRALLQQILSKQQHIPSTVGGVYKRAQADGNQPSIAELQKALAVCLKGYEKVWILVDALDQLGDRTSLIKVLIELVTGSPQHQNIHVAFASRYVSYYIEPAIGSFKWINTTRIDITPDQVEDDILKVVRGIMSNHDNQNQTLGDWIDPRVVVDKANGSFLWARLVLEEAASKKDSADFNRQLATSTNSVNHVYDRILEELNSEGKELVRWTLAFICLAIRPVSGLEVQYAIASLVSEPTLVSLSQDRSDTLLDIDTIVEQCRGLISFDTETGILTVSHQTVREWYLGTERLKWAPLLRADAEIAWECLSHMFQLETLQTPIGDHFLEYPLLSYSARHWAHHLSRMPMRNQSIISKFLFNPEAVKYWLKLLRAEKVEKVETAETSASVEELEAMLPALADFEPGSAKAFAEKLGFFHHDV